MAEFIDSHEWEINPTLFKNKITFAQGTKPKRIFHYTSITGLQGILEKRTLRFTNINYLNDKDEITAGVESLAKIIDGTDEQKEKLFTPIHELGERTFVCCFSLKECEVVIFLLTKNFYNSEYCLNEMGAVWYSDKKFIPVMLGNLNFNDMKGFLDSHYIALRPKQKETYKLFVELQSYVKDFNNLQSPEIVFKDFIEEANKVVEISKQDFSEKEVFISETEKTLLRRRFTDNEVIFLNYFIETATNSLKDVTSYNPITNEDEKSSELEEFENYCSKYVNFDYNKAKSLLKKDDEKKENGYLTYLYDNTWNAWDKDYLGCELDRDFFRDLISLSERGKNFIVEILTKHKKVDISATAIGNENELETLLIKGKLSEIEVLLLAFMLSTNQMSLGTRWKAAETISNIAAWEVQNKLFDCTLSRNYEHALNGLINREMLDIASYTSYGNPREYRLKQPLINQLYTLSPRGKLILNATIQNNITENLIDEIPFD